MNFSFFLRQMHVMWRKLKQIIQKLAWNTNTVWNTKSILRVEKKKHLFTVKALLRASTFIMHVLYLEVVLKLF